MNKCRVCHIIFETKEDLINHKETHKKVKVEKSGDEKTAEKIHFCNLCGKSFDKKHKLSKHKKEHEEENRNKCKICGETFDNKLMLLIHKNKHTAQKLTIVVKKKLPPSQLGSSKPNE